jgi:hypothetical protein
LAGPLGVQGLGRFFLDKVVDLLIEPDVVGMHGVEVELGPVDPLVGRRILGLGQGVDRGVLHVGHAAHADGVQPAPQGDQVCPRVRSLRSTSMPRMKSSAPSPSHARPHLG